MIMIMLMIPIPMVQCSKGGGESGCWIPKREVDHKYLRVGYSKKLNSK